MDTYTPYLTGDVTQAQIDAGTTAVLTAIYKLAPYFDLTVTALNGQIIIFFQKLLKFLFSPPML